MNYKSIQNDIQKKIELLNFYNKKYYDDNTSKIPDSEYDTLKKEILELEKNIVFYHIRDHLQE